MLIGVIADSHDNLPLIERVVELLNAKKAEFVIHAGDFVAPFSLKPMENLSCPWIGIFGNNDGDQATLTRVSMGRIQPAPFELNLDGKKVVVLHELKASKRKHFKDRGAELVIHGHTHEPAIEREGETLFVNPGEVGAWLKGRSSFVLVDTKTMEATIEEVETG